MKKRNDMAAPLITHNTPVKGFNKLTEACIDV